MIRYVFLRFRYFLASVGFCLYACQSEGPVIPHFSKQTNIPAERIHVSAFEQTGCLPYPSIDFVTQKANEKFNLGRAYHHDFDKDIVYFYLIMHLDSLNAKQVLETDPFWGPVKWTQSFENGVEYHHLDYVEAGSSGHLYTRCRDRQAFLYTVAPVIEENYVPEYGERHVWKHDSTHYEPKTQVAGCYYEIKQTADSCFYLKWYCGC